MSSGIEDMQATDLSIHHTWVEADTPLHATKQRRLTPDKEWWLRNFVLQGMEPTMYERTTVANGRVSR